MEQEKRILVTGGTGFLGSYLLRTLHQKGYSNITALKRPSSRMDLVTTPAKWVDCDILDVIGLSEIMKDIDQVYHCAAIVSFDKRDQEKLLKVNAEGTANVVNMALENNIEKMVHVSSVAAIGRSKKTTTIDENTKWENDKLNTVYGISKNAAEMEVWRGTVEGLNAVIVNPSSILGASFFNEGTAGFFTKIERGLKFYPTGTTGYVDVRDVTEIMVQLMESDISKERFLLNGENIPYKTFFDQIADAMNLKAPSIEVTPLIAGLAWRLDYLRSLFTGKRPMITKETATISAKVSEYKNDKIKAALNVEFRPIHQTISEVASIYSQMKEQGSAVLE